MWEVTDLLAATNNDPVFITSFQASTAVTDDQQNNASFVLIDQTTDLEDDPQVYVYVASPRVGIEVLRFDPDATPELTYVDLIQTPGNVWGLSIREDASEVRTLIVSDLNGGVRLYGYNQNP